MRKQYRLDESEMRDFVCELVRETVNNLGTLQCLCEGIENEDEFSGGDEFEFGDSMETRPGSHQQVIIYRGEEIGFLTTREKNWLAPLEEIYALPDVDAGITPPDDPDNNGLLDGKEGWIDFKTFSDYDEAFNYAKNNFDQIVYLFQNGDWD